MKTYRVSLKIILFIAIVIMFSHLPAGCKDPHDFEPELDSLIPPPEAPQLISPSDSAGWVYIEALGPVLVDFNWTEVEGVEYYELQLGVDTTFSDPSIYKISYNNISIAFLPRIVYWRVRAASSRWTWFTDWSEIRYCRIWWPVE
jgi:hypothetical protein